MDAVRRNENWKAISDGTRRPWAAASNRDCDSTNRASAMPTSSIPSHPGSSPWTNPWPSGRGSSAATSAGNGRRCSSPAGRWRPRSFAIVGRLAPFPRARVCWSWRARGTTRAMRSSRPRDILEKFPGDSCDVLFAFGPRPLKPQAARAWRGLSESCRGRVRTVAAAGSSRAPTTSASTAYSGLAVQAPPPAPRPLPPNSRGETAARRPLPGRRSTSPSGAVRDRVAFPRRFPRYAIGASSRRPCWAAPMRGARATSTSVSLAMRPPAGPGTGSSPLVRPSRSACRAAAGVLGQAKPGPPRDRRRIRAASRRGSDGDPRRAPERCRPRHGLRARAPGGHLRRARLEAMWVRAPEGPGGGLSARGLSDDPEGRGASDGLRHRSRPRARPEDPSLGACARAGRRDPGPRSTPTRSSPTSCVRARPRGS